MVALAVGQPEQPLLENRIALAPQGDRKAQALLPSSALHRNLGLGLFIARAIVIAHGGEIGVTSTAESGTTFEVALPR